MKSLYRIFLSIALIFSALSAGAQTLAQQADQAYSAEQYPQAISLYKQAIAQDGTSSAIWYNLGNAYYRADSLAQAILAYERALLLDPTNDDARQNLEFVNTKIIDVPSDTSSYSTIFIEKTMRVMTPNAWAWVSLALFVIVLLLAAGYIFGENPQMRKVCFFSGIVLIFVTAAAIIITVAVTTRVTAHNRAVITAESSQLSTSPATPTSNAQQAFLLHAGTVVTVLDSVPTPLDPRVPMWYEVKVDNEHRAWIDSRDLEVI